MSDDRELPGLRMIDAIYDNIAYARNTAGRLGHIASALETLGMMPNIVEDLFAIGEDMQMMAKRVNDAHGDVQSEQMGHNAAMTTSLLEMALVVIPERAELAERRAKDAVV